MRGLRAALLACSVAAAGGCSSDEGAVEAGSGPSVGSTFLGAAPSASNDRGTASASSTMIPYDLVRLTSSCEEYVPLAAFTGDLEMQALWTSLTQDPVVLTVWCAEIANSDPGRLVPMVDGIDELRRGLDEPITEPPETGPATRATDPLGGSTTVAGEPSPETVTTPAPNTQPPPASTPVTSGPVMPRVERGVMPAVVCLTLSEAEQQLARAGEYSPVALDLSGGADADEPDPLSIVVTQSPRAGAAIADGAVRLGVLAPGRPAGC